ncbi:hypothetical protein [Photobacterium angustum]|uniref:Uncharacterized protein n=1 Tax=Photobacterium angustum TaxID=661 RepID=A0ABX5H670_PHOAN|nr:hypothetical protein [Photobacterium angustum]PSX11388.1 hypothetical protein C0W27_06650 [Photobacterium angustum]
MKKGDKVFYTFLVILVLVYFYIFWGKWNDDRFAHIESLSANSNYSAPPYAEKYGVALHGKLGAMYDCLTKYRLTSIKRYTKGKSGPSGAIDIKVDEYELYLGVTNGEVVSSSLTKYNHRGEVEYATRTVAVNCDIDLLNKLE